MGQDNWEADSSSRPKLLLQKQLVAPPLDLSLQLQPRLVSYPACLAPSIPTLASPGSTLLISHLLENRHLRIYF